MTPISSRFAILISLLITLPTERAAAQGGSGVSPQLQVTHQADALSFRLTGVPVNAGQVWVLQSSAGLGSWDDLLFLDDNAEAVLSIAQQDPWGRFFRARRLDADDPALREFLTAQNIWRSAGIHSYTIEVEHGISFLFWHGIVTVENNQVVSAVPIDTNFFEPPQARTIDDWFARLKQLIDQKPKLIEVTYNAVYGYTESAYIDLSFMIADEEEGWSILDFQPQP